MKLIFSLLLLVFIRSSIWGQTYKVIESKSDHIIIEFDFKNQFPLVDKNIDGKTFTIIKSDDQTAAKVGEPDLPKFEVNVGVPGEANPGLLILNSEQKSFSNKFIIPFADSLIDGTKPESFQKNIYQTNKLFPEVNSKIANDFVFRFSRIITLSVYPFQFNPITRELIKNEKLTVRINYNTSQTASGYNSVDDKTDLDILKSTVINFNEAKNWSSKSSNYTANPVSGNYWYNSQKDYYKIYLEDKGVYRLSYDYLLNLGVPVQSVPTNKLQMFNDEKEIPIYVKDADSNDVFNSGDYIEFVGFPPKPSPYAWLNIYNNSNLYWFSFQADTTGLRYKQVDGTPKNWIYDFQMTKNVLHFEKDSLYERLGHAVNDKRDYWMWGKSSGQNGSLLNAFSANFLTPSNLFLDSTKITVRVNMHGMTTNDRVNPDHKVKVSLTSQSIGTFTWDGPTAATFETTIDLNTTHIYPDVNYFQVAAYGDIPVDPIYPLATKSDEIRVNWFELEYWRELRSNGNHYTFKSTPGYNGETRYNVFKWQEDNMKVFIPQNGEIIKNVNITHDIYGSTLFGYDIEDTVEFFCTAENYFLLPDSLIKDNHVSNLRSTSHGADYIIITHEKFQSIAEQLYNLRSKDFPDTSIQNPRIDIVQIQDIYDEFSGGLLDPFAVQKFVKYTFENWQSPKPAYVVLIGDMSYDYRQLLPDSRPNFIPSIPYHAYTYGQSASDNNIVTVSGNDLVPDLAIGRLSIETVAEGEILIQKLIDYPGDKTKKWKQNALLIASGQDNADELVHNFNDESLLLENTYLNPNGFTATKVFRFPNKPTHYPFQGDGPEIREGFNEGAVLANYYGHGGSAQWDLVFLNDDIYELNNGGRLPFISSVTCYTAHFDNQDAFGEKFLKVPDKGCIAFWGSSGLTWWTTGVYINKIFNDETFNKEEYVSGKAILKSKIRLGAAPPYNASQVALLTLFGDPILKLALPDKPDFTINQNDISIIPANPLTTDTVNVKIKVNNFGRIFSPDSVNLELYASSSDTSYKIGQFRFGNFGELDSAIFKWNPKKGGLYKLTAKVNEIEVIPEMDYSDNEGSASFAVYDLGEPNIIKPNDGFSTSENSIDVLLVDNGHYLGLSLTYFIEIDSTSNFINPILTSGSINPKDGLLEWKSPHLSNGIYYWRTRIYNGTDSSFWSKTRTFEISGTPKEGYYISNNQLKMFQQSNLIYSDSLKSLILNTKYLPPHPSTEKLLSKINVTFPSDVQNLSSITTDGTYIYFASMAYFNNSNPSPIYKLGTGLNGTVAGQNYGSIPNVSAQIWHTMFFHSDGFIYAATGDYKSLLRINPNSGDTSRVIIPDGLLNENAQSKNGAFYLSSDGKFVYNLAYRDSVGNSKYTVRVFDPASNWNKAKNDLILSGSSYPGFSSFFVTNGYLYAYENYESGYMRMFDLSNGSFIEEWLSYDPFQGLFAWCYDWQNDFVYSSVFRSGYASKIFKFAGKYKDAKGTALSPTIGPAAEWKSMTYTINASGAAGTYEAKLEGLNKNNGNWESIESDLQNNYDLSKIDAKKYNYIRARFNFVDSSYGSSSPIQLTNMNVMYQAPAEIVLSKNNFVFSPDTVLQGLPIESSLKIRNVGTLNVPSLKVKYYLNASDTSSSDSAYFNYTVSIPKDSSVIINNTISTNRFLFNNKTKVVAETETPEFFTVNNIISKDFYVSRDSINPKMEVTFDGKEILNGDIVSSNPKIIISLEDNSPLPLDTSYFTIIYNNESLSFSQPDINYTYTPYPNSKSIIDWNPHLENGRNVLEVLARDASGNYNDTVSYQIIFYTYTENDIQNIFTIPNPFKDATYFTFELRGTQAPEELLIRIYTVAGRLIRDIKVQTSQLTIGFNKVYWDGRDQDGDQVANGLYFYKIVYKNNGIVKTATEKLAKVK